MSGMYQRGGSSLTEIEVQSYASLKINADGVGIRAHIIMDMLDAAVSFLPEEQREIMDYCVNSPFLYAVFKDEEIFGAGSCVDLQ